MITPWGYDVESLPPILDAATFDRMTGGRHAGDPAAVQAVSAASAAVRNACGWHVAPRLACRAVCTPKGRMVSLPTLALVSVESVKDGGAELRPGEYEARSVGLLRRAGFRVWAPGWGTVEVAYTSGFEPEACHDLASVVASLAEAALNAAVGTSSETAGGVSISYDTSSQSIAGAMERMGVRRALASYRLASAHGL